MKLLNTLRRLLSAVVPALRTASPRGEEEVKELRRRFKVRHHSFKLLLSGNNEALEEISALEELARGVRPFGEHALRAHCARVTTQAYRTIKHLEALSEAPQTVLLERFQHIKQQIDAVISTRRFDPPHKSAPFIMLLERITKKSVDATGAKTARLGEARNVLGMPVPPGFAVTTAGFEAFMEASGLHEEIDRRIQAKSDELNSRMALARELQDLIINAPLPEDLEKAMLDAATELVESAAADSKLVVRSSAVGEDRAGASFAGQYRSAVNVDVESLPRVYKEIIASVYSLEALSYRLNKGIPEESSAMGVGVLTMVNAVAGGVAYSRDPIGSRADSVLIYSVFGLPKQMVDGADAADFFALQRNNGTVLEHEIGHKHNRTIPLQHEGVTREPLDPELSDRSSISPAEAKKIYDLVMRLERHFGEPQDVEWALDEQGVIYILQSRPLPVAVSEGIAAYQLDLPLPTRRIGDGDDKDTPESSRELGRGMAVSLGVGSGPVHLLQREADMLSMPPGAVIVMKRPLPRFAPALAEASAVVAEEGGMAGHLAGVARELGKPALFGMVDAMKRLPQGRIVTVDADSMLVLDGRDDLRMERAAVTGNLMQGSKVHSMLMKILPYIAKLNLLDPQSSEFTARNCRSMHDIFRYCHEKALINMFEFGQDTPFPERAARLLYGGKSSQFKIIDLGDAFHHKTQSNKIRVEDIESRPFQAFWRGMISLPWEGPPAAEAKGLASVFHEAMLNPNLEPTLPSVYTAQNYFMVAPDFLSGQSRFGFHFATVEALVGDRVRENYISFQFKGGAADQKRREARASMICSLLEELGFEVERTLDWVQARLDNRSAATMDDRLAALGFLTMHTRQLDMVMGSPSVVLSYKERLLEQLGEFVT